MRKMVPQVDEREQEEEEGVRKSAAATRILGVNGGNEYDGNDHALVMKIEQSATPLVVLVVVVGIDVFVDVLYPVDVRLHFVDVLVENERRS